MEGLGELANLRELKLYYSSPFGGNTADSLLSCMSKLGVCNLRSLTIIGKSSDEDVLTHSSPPPCHLRRLHMVDFRFSIVPNWIVQLHMLRSLEVQVVSLLRHGVEVITGMTLLVHLRLIVENDVPGEGIIISNTAFTNLKEFSFRYNVPCLRFESGAMPRLERLLIECGDPGAQQDDGGILTGIEHLGSLKVFKVDIYMYGFDWKVFGSYCWQPPEEDEMVEDYMMPPPARKRKSPKPKPKSYENMLTYDQRVLDNLDDMSASIMDMSTSIIENRGHSKLEHDKLVRLSALFWSTWVSTAEWFEICLLDYDPASIYGHRTYRAGVRNDSREYRYFSIPKQVVPYEIIEIDDDPDGFVIIEDIQQYPLEWPKHVKTSVAKDIAGSSTYASKSTVIMGGAKKFVESIVYHDFDDYNFDEFEEDYAYEEDE
ncbi:hypothetical protein ACQ4PT_026963 [Festuca glaucescens]